MQLSSTARKALAAGLAVSTVVWSMAMFVMPVAFAAPHGNGCLINQSGTIYLVDNGVKRGFPSADVYASHGQNFGQVVTANSEDLSLPSGPVMVYRDGTLVKGPSDPLVYLVANGQKRGFISGAVYTGLGFSWNTVRTAAVNTFADLPTGANLESATERHTNGILVKDSTNTIWIMTATGKKGMPTMDVFNSYGYNMAEVVPANAADVAAANEGTLTARVVCADSGSVVNGSVNASLSSDTPAANSIIAGSSAVDLAHFTLTGSGTVTGLTLKRIGISADDIFSNVYLFDGSTRLTDASSVSSNSNIVFTNGSGLFTVNGSKTISVRADIKDGVAGVTAGVRLDAMTLSGGTVGGLPISGNTMSVADTDLATAAITNAADAPATAGVDPANDVVVWQRTVVVGVRDATLTRLALRQTNSINSADVKNFRLLVDGSVVSTVANLDSNGYVTFTMSKPLNATSHVLKVLTDVVGGSSRKLTMSLRGAYDLNITDSTFGVGVTATVSARSFPVNSGELTIGDASMTVSKASDSLSGNVTNNASDVTLGKWTVTAFGEPVKVETMNFGFATDSAATALRNGKVMINGSQYGNTKNLTLNGVGTPYTVNFTVQPGTPATVELHADIYAATGGAIVAGKVITARFLAGSGNGQGTVSAKSVDVPTALKDANQLIVAEGNTIGLSKQSNYSDQNTTLPQTAYKIGAFNLTGSSTEDINVDTIVAKITVVAGGGGAGHLRAADFTNVYVKYGTTTESVKATTAGTSTWNVNHVLAKNAVVPVEVYADISSDATADDSIKTELTVSGTTASSGVGASTATDFDGQTIVYKAGTFATLIDASSPASKLLDDNSTTTATAFKFTATNDSYTITEVTLHLAATSSVVNVILKDGSTVVATKPADSDITISGLSIPVNANSPKILTVDLQLGTIGVGSGTTNEDLMVSMTGYKVNNSQGVQKTQADESGWAQRDGNSMYAFRAVPTITPVTLPTSLLATGTQTISKFTVSSNGTGTVSWKKFILTVSKSAGPTIANATNETTGATASVWDADTNTRVAGSITVAGLSGAGTSGTITFLASNEQEISGAKTYVVKAVIGGDTSSGNSINTSIGSPSSHASSAGTFKATPNGWTYSAAGSTVAADDIRQVAVDSADFPTAAAGADTLGITKDGTQPVSNAYGLPASVTVTITENGADNQFGTITANNSYTCTAYKADGTTAVAPADAVTLIVFADCSKAGSHFRLKFATAVDSGANTANTTDIVVTNTAAALTAGSTVTAGQSDIGIALTGGVDADATFVWSDESALNHTVSTADWFNDFLVKNLPTDTQNMRP